MSDSTAIAHIEKATESAQVAVNLLTERARQPDAPNLHLPIEDLKIALRFLDFARTVLATLTPTN